MTASSPQHRTQPVGEAERVHRSGHPLVRREGEELGELVGHRHLEEGAARVGVVARVSRAAWRSPRRPAARPARGSRRRRCRSSMSLCSHCQTCEREISAVAASSIRLKMPTAPMPCSQVSRYWMPTLMLLRSPASVTLPGVDCTSSSCSAVTWTSSRFLSSWFGRSPRTVVKASLQISTIPGWATQEPSKPSPASRVLSSRTFCERRLVDLGVLARDERRHAADRVRAALVAGAHQQLGVGAHERHRHGDLRCGPAGGTPCPGCGTS